MWVLKINESLFMKIKASPFKSWDKQIEKLNQLGNNFLDKNPKDKQKILRYLKNYNFQISVNAFTPLLWNNLNDWIEEKNLHFIHNFQFDDLIGLFKFDRLLKILSINYCKTLKTNYEME